MALKIRINEAQLTEVGVESIKVGYAFMGLERKSCMMRIICELKVVNDKKFKGGYMISFAVLDDSGDFVGAAEEWIRDRKDYLNEGLFTNDFVTCSVNAKNIREIKVYVKKY